VLGAAHFQVSLNGADFDAAFDAWRAQAELLGAAPAAAQARTRMRAATVTFWELPLLAAVAPAVPPARPAPRRPSPRLWKDRAVGDSGR